MGPEAHETPRLKGEAAVNILPETPDPGSVDYWCTWKRQCAETRPGNAGISETLLFEGPGAWARFYPEICSELYFVLDEGWDVPLRMPEDNLHLYGTLDPDAGKFPSLKGDRTERLARLNERVKSFGWKGAGLWIAANHVRDGKCVPYAAPDPGAEAYWRERILSCRDAGIQYWKVDWGNVCESMSFRRMLTDAGHELAPELVIEHGRGYRPFNGTGEEGNCRFTQDEDYFCYDTGLSTFSDVIRTYDVSFSSAATTLDRIASYVTTSKGIINCEDELYMGAVLGCAVGIMRYPGDPEGKAEEALAAVRWHREAPPFSGGGICTSDRLMTDLHYFTEKACGMTGPALVRQQAPAVISRRTALPEVRNGDEPLVSFVAAAFHPGGAYSVGAFRRQTDEGTSVLPHVVCRPEKASSRIGVFGDFASLELDLRGTGRRAAQVTAQSLIRGEAEDVTALTVSDGCGIRLSRELLNSFNTASDDSETALMLEIRFGG